MPAPSIITPLSLPAGRRRIRVEYLDFRDVPDYREYRLAVYGDGPELEVRFRIASAAFGAGRIRLQDGPDFCYRKLLSMVTAGGTTVPEVLTIEDDELGDYREAHTPVPKHSPWTQPTLPPKPAAAFLPRTPPRPSAPQMPVAKPATSDREPGLDKGQRVHHEIFGIGVVTSSSGTHTVVCFDEGGTKSFVTSMVELEVLSAPHTWETGPRGKNRPRVMTFARP
jgi:hypothetical protein